MYDHLTKKELEGQPDVRPRRHISLDEPDTGCPGCDEAQSGGDLTAMCDGCVLSYNLYILEV